MLVVALIVTLHVQLVRNQPTVATGRPCSIHTTSLMMHARFTSAFHHGGCAHNKLTFCCRHKNYYWRTGRARICDSQVGCAVILDVLYEIKKKSLIWSPDTFVRALVSTTKPFVRFSWNLVQIFFLNCWGGVIFVQMGSVTGLLHIRT
jgi:hypothetical protein